MSKGGALVSNSKVVCGRNDRKAWRRRPIGKSRVWAPLQNGRGVEDSSVSHTVPIILERTPGIESYVRKNYALLLYVDDALCAKDRRL